ncbi:dynamin family protein [Moellerella wisconsensis]|uniref:Dynamin family protein n=1 Tax=Moellerella wisconsensis TaxID=158849 RepID=A0ACD3Y584_9GAMM|nr:dynamin family protein [Moellerella wisconsensis]UNH37953.1 dynamin family protein [Moellerella wisconsensis]
MKKQMLRRDFLESFKGLQKSFESSLVQAKALDSNFNERYDHFHRIITTILHDALKNLSDGNPISDSVREFISAMENQDKALKNNIKSHDKGITFREKFEDSLLVYIYGKVKSGKSSLGNYIALGHTDPENPVEYAQDGLRYFSHEQTNASNGDIQGAAVKQGKFRVGSTEATSSIQGFNLYGLTWVDSPGLHSVQDQNGNLAREYADHADLILYTMRSDAPGRASDFVEIKSLIDKNKSIMLLLTGSDNTEEDDWDEDTDQPIVSIVMKTEDSRQEQQKFVRTELEKVCPNSKNIDILSISARYAELHENDRIALDDSGMGTLFYHLERISQEDGVQMKRRAPANNFKYFLDGCKESLEIYRKQTSILTEKINNISKDTDKNIIPLIYNAKASIQQEIVNEFNQLYKDRNNELLINEALKKAQVKWDRLLEDEVNNAVSIILSKVLKDFKSAVNTAWSTSNLSLPTFTVEKVIEEIPDHYEPGTRKRNSGIGGFLGTAIGFAVGGPVGAAIGGTLGGGLGAATGNSGEYRTKKIELSVGDNLNSIQERVNKSYQGAVENLIYQSINYQLGSYLDDASKTCQKLEHNIQDFNHKLDSLIQQTEILAR